MPSVFVIEIKSVMLVYDSIVAVQLQTATWLLFSNGFVFKEIQLLWKMFFSGLLNFRYTRWSCLPRKI